MGKRVKRMVFGNLALELVVGRLLARACSDLIRPKNTSRSRVAESNVLELDSY